MFGPGSRSWAIVWDIVRWGCHGQVSIRESVFVLYQIKLKHVTLVSG